MIPPKSKKQKQAPTLVHLAQQTIIANAQFIQDIESLTPNLYKPILQQVEVHQLRRIEENNSALDTQDIWKAHYIKEYPLNKDTMNETKDWKKAYLERKNQEERKVIEVGEKLRKRYQGIQREKQGKKIEVTNVPLPPKKRPKGSLFSKSLAEAQKVSIWKKKRL